MTSIDEVFVAIRKERQYQMVKFEGQEQSLPGFLIILENELEEAKKAWTKGGAGRQSAMQEVLQVATVAVAAMELYGTTGCPVSTYDLVKD